MLPLTDASMSIIGLCLVSVMIAILLVSIAVTIMHTFTQYGKLD
jgi:hypothetical protein